MAMAQQELQISCHIQLLNHFGSTIVVRAPNTTVFTPTLIAPSFLLLPALLMTPKAPCQRTTNGGALESAASARCTWAQTRFLVQIWTNMGTSAALLSSNSSTSTASASSSSSNSTDSNASANDYTQPGSFPYPVTVTLDRHGGDPTLKMIYCYGVRRAAARRARREDGAARESRRGGHTGESDARRFRQRCQREHC